MRHLPGLAWIKDLQGRYVYVNDAAEKAFQTPRGKLYGNMDEDIFPPETAKQFRANDQMALASDAGVAAIETLKEDDGVVHHSVVSKFAIRDSDGALKGTGGVAIDVTERVETERRLREATAKLKEADRRKDEFLATLAHELRNPLAAIHNGLQVSLKTKAQGSAARMLEIMARQVDHLVRLVDDLLEVSRISTGKIELKKETLDLTSVLKHAVDMTHEAVEKSGLELHVSLPKERLLLHGDPVRLVQVFSNLLNNAAKYTNPGGRVDVVAARLGDEAVVTVSDTGAGISAEMLPRVFDLFAQVHVTLGRARGGLGIGLALVRNLVRLHHGAVEAHSAGEGQGSQFVVRLPLAGH
jgi:PAS domain S-box-containing protein